MRDRRLIQLIRRTAIVSVLSTLMLMESVTARTEPPREQIVGTWKLLSWVTHSGGEQKPGVLGPGTLGQFMLNPSPKGSGLYFTGPAACPPR